LDRPQALVAPAPWSAASDDDDGTPAIAATQIVSTATPVHGTPVHLQLPSPAPAVAAAAPYVTCSRAAAAAPSPRPSRRAPPRRRRASPDTSPRARPE